MGIMEKNMEATIVCFPIKHGKQHGKYDSILGLYGGTGRAS